MNPLLPDVKLVVERLSRLPGVTKVVAGSISKSPHSHRSGELKWVGKQNKSATVRVYSASGMQNLHVYALDLDRFQQSLVAAVPKPNGHGSPLTAESAIERTSRREQPVYPAVPSAIKSAPPVKTEVRGQVVEISPDVAINWLERNSRNRPLRQNDVERYANDMKAGRWKLGGVVIKFATDGTIINGQHTLWAIITSGCTIQAHVLTGLDPSVVMVEDDHARRRLTDVIRITHPGATVTNLHTAVATMLRYTMAWQQGGSGQNQHVTRQQEMAFLDQFMEPITFAVKSFYSSKGRSRGIVSAPVLTPLARAWYTEDRSRLERFAHVVKTGLVDDIVESSAVLLRNHLLTASSSGNATTLSIRQETYRRTERALRAFLDKERLTVLRASNEEMFLLPGERRKPRKG